MATDLITLDELKYALSDSVSESTPDLDQRLRKAISAASDAVRKYADRNFGQSLVEQSRIYDYDRSGYQDIDDCWEVQSVSFTYKMFNDFPLEEYYWRAEPFDGPPFEYIIVPKWAGVYSPEMGFTRNLDRISKEPEWTGVGPQIKVKGKYGWPDVPDDVRMAVIWTASSFAKRPEDQLAAESIANYSYTTMNRLAGDRAQAIPQEAQDILAPYVRFIF